jgi:hypothetical protein
MVRERFKSSNINLKDEHSLMMPPDVFLSQLEGYSPNRNIEGSNPNIEDDEFIHLKNTLLDESELLEFQKTKNSQYQAPSTFRARS